MKGPEHNHIDDLFYNGLEGHSEYPTGSVWDKIEIQLDKDIARTYKRQYQTIKRYAFVLLVLLLGFVVYEIVSLNFNKDAVNPAISANKPTDVRALNEKTLPSIQNNKDQQNVRADEKGTDYEEKEIDAASTISANSVFLRQRSLPGLGAQAAVPKIATGIVEETSVVNDALETKAADKADLLSIPDLALSNLLISGDKAQKAPQIFIPAKSTNVILAKQNSIPRFSFSTIFSTGIAWNSINDDKNMQRSGNSNSGSNGGGNNGGNPVSGGNVSGINIGGSIAGRDSNRIFKGSESANLAYSGGIKLSYDLNNKLSIGTGLNYLITSTSLIPQKVYAEKGPNGDVGYRLNSSSGYSFLSQESGPRLRPGDSAWVSGTRNKASYVGVPLMVEYKLLSHGRFTVKASAGGQVNLLLKASTKSVIEKGTPVEVAVSANTEGLKPAYLSMVTSLAGEMQLSKAFSITLAPVAQFGLTNVNDNNRTSVKTRPNYLGLAAGLKIKF